MLHEAGRHSGWIARPLKSGLSLIDLPDWSLVQRHSDLQTHKKRQKNIVSKKKKNESKENSYTDTNKKYEKENDSEIRNLDRKPYLVSPLSLGRGGHHATPLRWSEIPFLGPYLSRGGIELV